MNMVRTKLRPWDSAEHLKTEKDRVLYLEACLEENDAALIARALGVIAKARDSATYSALFDDQPNVKLIRKS
jgi:probable addiction module antidote protein